MVSVMAEKVNIPKQTVGAGGKMFNKE